MARKTYTIKMTFSSEKRPGWEGKLEETLRAKSHIRPTIEHYRGWLKAKGHTETSLLVTDEDGNIL